MAFETDYAKYYDLFNQSKDYNNEINFLEQVFKKFLSVPVKSILDLGCGTGLHTKELIKIGYEVTGIDLSKEMIGIAKKRNSKANFIASNMSDFNLNEKFDAIICMFSSLGYLTENYQIDSFFKCCKKHLKENGLLILDVWNGLAVMRELPSSREKISEIPNMNLKIIRKSFPTLDAKNHLNNVKFLVRVFEKVKNKSISNVIQNEVGEVKSSIKSNKSDNRDFTSDILLDTNINKKLDYNIKNNENWKLIKEYEENHKVRFFFPQEIRKYMNDNNFQLIHLCPSFEIDSEVSEKNWNMILVGRLKNK